VERPTNAQVDTMRLGSWAALFHGQGFVGMISEPFGLPTKMYKF